MVKDEIVLYSLEKKLFFDKQVGSSFIGLMKNDWSLTIRICDAIITIGCQSNAEGLLLYRV